MLGESMSIATSTPLLEMHDARCTLECGGSTLSVVRFEERRSLARAPEIVVDVVVGEDMPASLVREPAGLLVERPDGSRYVQGWVRGVERYGDARLGVRLRVLLVPTTLLADAGAQAGEESVEPAYVYDPAAWAEAAAAEARVVSQGEPTPGPTAVVQKDADEDAETSTHQFSHAELRALRGEPRAPTPEPVEPEPTMVLDADQSQAPRATGGGTELMSRADVLRMLAGAPPSRPPVPRDAASPTPEETQERTERVPMDHVTRMARSVAGGIARMQEAAEPSPRLDQTSVDVATSGERQPGTAEASEGGDGTRHWSREDLAELRRRAKQKG